MRIVSLFCGAGGLDFGLVQSGHEIVWANDNDADAIATYHKNISAHAHCADIRDVLSSEIPDAEVVVGGFPCQGFSQANMRRSADDERNFLYIEFLRVVRDKQPKWFLAENVRGILSLDDGKAIQKIEKDFASLGYRVSKRLYNAADFGVPQCRHRVIIAGTRDDLPYALDYPFLEPTHQRINVGQEMKKGLLPWNTIGDALKDIPEPEEKHHLPNHIGSLYKVTNRNFTGHRATDPHKPSPTILARGNGKGGVCAIQHPKNHRRMTIRESATVQGFPLDFEFVGGLGSCYRQVGNAVPVDFARALGQRLSWLEQFENSLIGEFADEAGARPLLCV
jgi:DNA (cytosine-5)-methyltransferase 1